MKKIFTIMFSTFVFLSVGNIASAGEAVYPQEFINALEKCKPYTYTTKPINLFGMKISATKKIVGIKNGLCQYTETTGPANSRTTFNCKFNKSQINKLVTDMRNNSNKSWGEYANNPDVCKW